MVIGAPCTPCSFDQFWIWTGQYMHKGSMFHMVGLAAMCWALWRVRNNICFEKKIVKSPTEIICLASCFITFWAALQKGDKELLEAGAEALKSAVLHFHPHEAPPEDAGVMLLQ